MQVLPPSKKSAHNSFMKDDKPFLCVDTSNNSFGPGNTILAFDEALKEQKTLFVNANNEVISGLREQFEQLPQAVTAINNLKELPKQMQRLLDDVNASNQKIVSELRRALPSVVIQGGSTSGNNLAASPIVQPVLRFRDYGNSFRYDGSCLLLSTL